jgi:uncharacterized protein (TIGR01244 family)
MSVEEIYNYLKVDEHFSTAGMPLAQQLTDAARQGFSAVINLATYNPGHSLENEAELAQSLGMAYFHIPVDWEAPKAGDFETFMQVMDGLGRAEGRVLVHCAANFRATAFFSLYAQKRLGWDAQRAQALMNSIWQDGDYPVWKQFIRETGAQDGQP